MTDTENKNPADEFRTAIYFIAEFGAARAVHYVTTEKKYITAALDYLISLSEDLDDDDIEAIFKAYFKEEG